MYDASTFSVTDYLSEQDITTAQGRMLASWNDPLAFALIYCPGLITDAAGDITFAEAHFEWVTQAKTWISGLPGRDAYIAPRGLGKSSWWFTIFVIWAAAYQYTTYTAAFSAAAQQAQDHLAKFKRQMDTNPLLRKDFPTLCKPAMRYNGKPVADREDKYVSDSGFCFDAQGMDSSIAGKTHPVTGKRPDLIILDDIEPDESSYSAGLKAKRLKTVLNNVFYLNIAARVIISGTVTMDGSIMHDLVASLTEDPEDWISELKPPIRVHHHLPIVEDDQGHERSIWPGNAERFDLDYMRSIRHTSDFLMQYANSPLGGNGDYWKPGDVKYGSVDHTGLLLSIDPAVTSKKASDETGLALVGWSPKEKKCVVVECWGMRVSPDELAKRVARIVEDYPVKAVLVETNQGGDVWKSILKDIPVKVHTVHQSDKKEVRMARVYSMYTRGLVLHEKPLPRLEAQMVTVPKGLHDDMVDAVCSGVAWFSSQIKQKKQIATRPGFQSTSWA